MYFLPIILATILGSATTVPVNTSGIKERIFSIAVTPNEKIAEIKEILQTSGASTRNSLIEDLIWSAVDMLRDVIINGSGDVPVLDPFKLEELHVDDEILNLPNSHVTLKDVTVSNLGTFEIDRLRVSTVNIILQRYRIELDGRIPVLDSQVGSYDLSINIFGGNVFGNGEMSVKIVNPRIKANIVVGLRVAINGIFLTVRECKIRADLDAFEVQVTGFFGNEVTSEFVSTFLSLLVPELLEFFEEDITNTLSSTVLEVANNILRDLNLIDLLP